MLSPAIVDACGIVGLEYLDTAGGNSALELELSDECYVLILSEANEGCAPVALDEPVSVGTHRNRDDASSGLGEWMQFPTLLDAILDIYGPIEGCALPPELDVEAR